MKKYPTLDGVKILHQILIKVSGGSDGLRDENALDAALMRPQTGYYENIVQEAAALMESLAVNHPFIDGNKRIAFVATDAFLKMNGYYIDCDDMEAYAFIIGLFESNTFNYANLFKWLEKTVKAF